MDEKYTKPPWSRLPPDILKWTQEEVFDPDGGAQNYGGNSTFYEDEVDSIVDWLIPNIKGKVFFDVGANLGIWSVVATLCGAKEIHMFDPGSNLAYAEKNVKHAGNIPVYMTKKFVCSRDGLEGKERQIDAEIALDDYQFAPGFIKIDTEGAEFSILKGAQNIIKKYHPMLMVESHSGPERDGEIITLVGEGYKVDPIKDLGNHRHLFFY